MKLKQLKKQINEISTAMDDVEVVLQKDGEGNGYSPLSGVDDNAFYAEENSWSGYVLSGRWSAKDANMTDSEWEEFKKTTPKCIVLLPTN